MEMMSQAHGRTSAIKRTAVASMFEGAGVAFFVTMVVGGFTGMITRERWLTGNGATFSLTLAGMFVASWIVSTVAISYYLSRQSEEE